MNNIEDKELIEIIKKFKNNGIYIRLEGAIESVNTIHKLDFAIQYDILRLTDKISKDYFTINLNQVYKIKTSNDKNVVKLYLDNDIIVTIIN